MWQTPQGFWCSLIVWWPVLGGVPWHAPQLVMVPDQLGVPRVPPALAPELLFTAWHHVLEQLAAVVPLRAV